MIGMSPQVRIELARSYRDGQIEAAAARRLQVEAAEGREERPARGARLVLRLRPQQLRP